MYTLLRTVRSSPRSWKGAASNVAHEVGAVGLQMPIIYLKTLAQLVFKKLFHKRKIFFFITQNNETS